jgi:hypothetical protein
LSPNPLKETRLYETNETLLRFGRQEAVIVKILSDRSYEQLHGRLEEARDSANSLRLDLFETRKQLDIERSALAELRADYQELILKVGLMGIEVHKEPERVIPARPAKVVPAQLVVERIRSVNTNGNTKK